MFSFGHCPNYLSSTTVLEKITAIDASASRNDQQSESTGDSSSQPGSLEDNHTRCFLHLQYGQESSFLLSAQSSQPSSISTFCFCFVPLSFNFGLVTRHPLSLIIFLVFTSTESSIAASWWLRGFHHIHLLRQFHSLLPSSLCQYSFGDFQLGYYSGPVL